MTDIPDAYLIGNAITRACPEPECETGPGDPCVNVISKQPMHMPHIKRQKPDTTSGTENAGESAREAARRQEARAAARAELAKARQA
ncbi:hypothetical protein [Williamsia sp. DF01-3]|uniref:hypothetical protein n=1 Tax=Williamsia sp. DF01-3 TaxID=2934157 RepID=UPI001FF6B3B0|nr:hypothetical protein [Williamsia sp. DF01-3]MCK0517890.1 hypothetical protein [Williamsia sp. DF01-3]